MAFLDDILIFKKSRQENEKLFRRVAKKHNTYGLQAKQEKCEFFKEGLEYMG
jgi:Reverse transcriptase (RNA-dependent DNA polymerase)